MIDAAPSSAGNLALQSNATGAVGIGTAAPTAGYKLHVVGNGLITGNVTASGTISGGNVIAKYQDVAEWVDAVADLEPGTVVVIDNAGINRVLASSREYDARVAGGVSPPPGLILGEPGEGRELIAQSGRVRVKVDAKYGSIRPGDLLVTSPTPGHAMRSRPVNVNGMLVHRPGTIIGKALQALSTGNVRRPSQLRGLGIDATVDARRVGPHRCALRLRGRSPRGHSVAGSVRRRADRSSRQPQA